MFHFKLFLYLVALLQEVQCYCMFHFKLFLYLVASSIIVGGLVLLHVPFQTVSVSSSQQPYCRRFSAIACSISNCFCIQQLVALLQEVQCYCMFHFKVFLYLVASSLIVGGLVLLHVPFQTVSVSSSQQPYCRRFSDIACSISNCFCIQQLVALLQDVQCYCMFHFKVFLYLVASSLIVGGLVLLHVPFQTVSVSSSQQHYCRMFSAIACSISKYFCIQQLVALLQEVQCYCMFHFKLFLYLVASSLIVGGLVLLHVPFQSVSVSSSQQPYCRRFSAIACSISNCFCIQQLVALLQEVQCYCMFHFKVGVVFVYAISQISSQGYEENLLSSVSLMPAI